VWPVTLQQLTSRQHLSARRVVLLLEVVEHRGDWRRWLSQQMRNAIAPNDLKALRSARGDDELALLTADQRINI